MHNNFTNLKKAILLLLLLNTINVLAQNSPCPPGQDSDNDGVCNVDDVCAGYDDTFDIDDDGIPYYCDTCVDINENDICDTNNDPDPFGDHKVFFSKKRGIYTNGFQLELISKNPNAQIRYTTNGTAPTTSTGTVYTAPININTTAYIRAIAYTNAAASKVHTHSYIFPADVINQPNSRSNYPSDNYAFDASIKNDATYGGQLIDALTQVPSLSLVMDLTDLNTMHGGALEFPASIELIFPNGDKGEQANAGVERAGGSSFNSTKRNLRLSFKSIYGDPKFDFPIFGEDAASDFDQIALRPGFHGCMHLGINHSRGGSNDIADQVVRNYQLNISKEGTAIHGSFMHLYINGVYWGVYNPTERGNSGFAESYYGGKKDDFDAIKSKLPLDGTIDAWNTLNNMVDNLDMSQAANYNNVKEYVNVEQFTEYVIITNYAPHSDDHLSGKNSFATRDRTKNEGFRFWIWDTEPALGHHWTWNVAPVGSNPYNNIFFSLLDNTDYRTMVGDQVECHCFNDGALTPNKAIEEYLEVYNSTNIAMLAEAARWVTKAEYTEFINTKNRIVNQYLPNRTNDFLTLYRNENLYPSIDAVQFSQYGGAVANGFQLSLTNPNGVGTIYYTTDGSDPRASGGGIANSAQVYNAAVTLPLGAVEIKARVKSGSTWSAMCPRLFYVGQSYSNLVINEIHYQPTDSILYSPLDTIKGSNFGFVELKNRGNSPVALKDVAFNNGIDLTITDINALVPIGGFAVFAEDADWFEARYGFPPDGQYAGKIDSDGEKITLADPFGNPIDSVRFYNENPWDEAPDGEGYSLELLHHTFDNNEALNWFRSDNIQGTPKAENSRTCSQSGISIVINEINYNSDNDNFDAGDWIELYNPNSFPVDISGWTFYDNNNAFVIPSGTIMGVDGYLVLIEDNALFTNAFPNVSNYIGEIGFLLSNKGERISLFDENKCLSDYVIYDDKAPWPTTPDGDGTTLALTDANLDNALASSWLASNVLSSSFPNGSPGRPNDCAPNQPCCDGNANTINDTYDNNCNCIGTPVVGPPDLVLCDDGNPLTLYDVFDGNTCTCAGVIISETVCLQVSSGLDDAEEQVTNGSMNLSSGDLDLGSDNGLNYLVGIRFQNSALPQGATITNAYLQFTADESSGDATTIVIKGEAQNNPTAYVSTAYNISTRPTTGASASWTIPTWGTVGQRGANQQSIDISSVIQEIVNQQNYQSGNALGLMLSGSGVRAADSFDGSAGNAPELCVTYSTGQCVVGYPCDDGNPNTIDDAFDANCNCVGTSILVQSKLILEGFYESANNQMHTKLKDNNLLPLSQPYNTAPWNYTGTESVTTFPTGVVDWVLVMARAANGNVIEQRAGFIHQSGNLISIDGTQGVVLQNGLGNNISIHHRSHLAIISSNVYTGGIYDFTISANQAQGIQQLKPVAGKYMLHAGDFDSSGLINSSDFNDWKIQSAVLNQYLPIDGDGNGIINAADYNLWINNRSKVGEQSIRY